MNIYMRRGEIDPAALISNQKMYDLLSTNEGINLTDKILRGYDHSGVYYGEDRDMLNCHRKNLTFSKTSVSDKNYIIGSVNTFLGDVFIEKGSAALPDDTQLLVVFYDEDDNMLNCQLPPYFSKPNLIKKPANPKS